MRVEVDQEIHTCSVCGIVYSAPAGFFREKRQVGGAWKCPNGHGQQFAENQADVLRRERDRLAQRVAYESDRADGAEGIAKHEAARANGFKGQMVRLQRRAAAGVCPCCTRSFTNLQRHMASQHPTFAESHGAGGSP